MGNNCLAPILLFVYNRPEHVEKVLGKLCQCRMAAESTLYIFSDGPKTQEDRENVEAVREIIHEFAKHAHFLSIKIREQKQNRGLANSIISGVTEIIEKYEQVIVLEDDLLVSVDFLEYMNGALQFYKDRSEVWSIAGYSPNISIPRSYREEVYVCLRAGSWGWATWKDRWDTIDWDVKDYDTFRGDKKARKAFQRRGENMPEMLDAQMEHKIDSWAIRFCYEQYKQNRITINPVCSRVDNLGVDGSGTHGQTQSKWRTKIDMETRPIVFTDVRENKQIKKAYDTFFSGTKKERIMRVLYNKFLGPIYGSLKRIIGK